MADAAPGAAAPTTAAAPTSNTTPAAPVTPTEAPKPPVDPFRELLAKSPVKYKANGKELSISDPDLLIRRLQQADGIDKVREEAMTARQRAEQTDALVARLKANPKEARKILGELMGDEAKARAALEEDLYETMQAEEEAKKLSPQERQRREEYERLKAEADGLRTEKQKREEAEKAQREEQEVAQVRDTLAKATLESMQAMKVPQALAPWMMRFVIPTIAQGLEAGLPMEAAQAKAIDAGHEMLREVASLVLSGGPQALEWLGDKGEGFLKATRAHDLERLRAQRGLGKAAQKPAEAAKPEGASPKRGRWEEIEKQFGKL